ncbi:hypothetical protein VIBNISO65_230005 [Vibrio nigripulchritudo SO65]|nr:hypothetical protein VIBNIAM115_1390005 [Vibrio nigripulchritudo AM115]CCN40462.1 hypothetical protein VIBNIFTn2_1290005 [Vibrio nigripulchritudo FTn2]CCN64093.1 hypothetical protein VIBNIPon4_180012 [Vibrio nigripulchritudo POn4]CCN77300.1 hypothetical protein VIBNISO65_230005 [Vibrio nigripulchritudo SO65]
MILHNEFFGGKQHLGMGNILDCRYSIFNFSRAGRTVHTQNFPTARQRITAWRPLTLVFYRSCFASSRAGITVTTMTRFCIAFERCYGRAATNRKGWSSVFAFATFVFDAHSLYPYKYWNESWELGFVMPIQVLRISLSYEPQIIFDFDYTP